MLKYLLLVFLVLGVLMLYAQTRRSSGPKRSLDQIPPKTSADQSIADLPVSFGYKCAWYAIRTTNIKRVSEVLAAKDPRPCNWKVGIDNAYSGSVYITPPIEGWTLVCGTTLMKDDPAIPKALLTKLSQEFGEAQFFATHRVVEFHCWAKAEKGQIIRYYAYLGESGENVEVTGEPTDVEAGLNLVNTLGPEADQEGYLERDDLTYPTEDEVMRIAAAWSLGPYALDKRTDVPPSLGLLCKGI